MNGSTLLKPRPYALITAKPTFSQCLANITVGDHVLALAGTGAAGAYSFAISHQWPFRKTVIPAITAFSFFSIYSILFYRNGLKLMGLYDNTDILPKYPRRLDTNENVVVPPQ